MGPAAYFYAMEPRAPQDAKTPPLTRRGAAGLLLAAVLLALCGPVTGPYQQAAAQQAIRDLSAPDAQARLESGELLLIDVRSRPEWTQTRIAEGALPITIHDPDGAKSFIAKVMAAAGGERGRPIAFICATGVRSAYAYNLLREAGYSNLYNVTEGMLGNPRYGPGWLKRGLPTQRCSGC